ncbi:DUF1259 domain-containing protein [Fictibacillus phosphorivorans]|uniref:DUF1259 domain-containing protein n=1 Tax=Fictibacillus phosphorivorans TaxID=1221500 RepID=UPI0035EC51B5
MDSNQNLCEQFAKILNGRSQNHQGVCSVSLHRTFSATVQGKPSKAVLPVGVSFESLDQSGNALNLLEIAVLQEEIPLFLYAVVHQGLIVSALHNHWLYVNPQIMYMHVQSVEPPLNFAQKVSRSFSYLSSYPSS